MKSSAALRPHEQAADALATATKVLIATGAGMSADSAIPTYRDEHGLWRDFEPFTRIGVQPKDIAHLDGYRRDPEAAWGFHEWMRRLIGRAEPHAGYEIVRRWVQEVFPQCFVLTTNVDELHLRSGLTPQDCWQRYGSIWELQCLEDCGVEPWRESRVPLCTLDEATLRASDLPRCPDCDAIARPRLQLDHDETFQQDAAGADLYERFVDPLDVDVYIVIGTTLWLTWPPSLGYQPTVIHINPDPATHARYEAPIAITEGAESSLATIDRLLRERSVGHADV